MTDRYENIRKALAMGPTPGPWRPSYDKGSTRDIFTEHGKLPVCMVRGVTYVGQEQYLANGDFIAACDPDTIRALLKERDALAEGLSDTEKDVAVAQAVEFAEYVERQAKGAMCEAARRFLSLPYSQEVAERLKERDALREVLGRILENEAPNYKFAEEFGGYVLDDELREEARDVLRDQEEGNGQ